jgi:hypothetical protein
VDNEGTLDKEATSARFQTLRNNGPVVFMPSLRDFNIQHNHFVEGGQVLVYNKEEAFTRFKHAN